MSAERFVLLGRHLLERGRGCGAGRFFAGRSG